MIAPPTPNEELRLQELRRYDILDTPPEEFYDRLTRMAAQACDVPIALVSLVDAKRQWFKSRVGLEVSETPRDIAFCAHAVLGRVPFIISDATQDPRFAGNPLVIGDAGIRFYAGVPLVTPTNHALGTLCVIDRKPRSLEPRQLEVLKLIAEQVTRELELRLLAANLHRKSALFAKTQSVAGIGGWSMTPQTQQAFWSDEMYRIHGIAPQPESPTLEFQFGLYDPECAVALRSAIDGAVILGKPFDLELSITRENGVVRWLRAIGDRQSTASGAPELIGVFHDITDSKSRTIALARTTERLTMAASAVVGLAMWEWTLSDNRMYWDEHMYRLHGRAPVGSSEAYAVWAESIHPEDRARVETILSQAVEQTGNVDTVFRVQRPDGQTRVIRAIAQTVCDPGIAHKRMLGFSQDITERIAEREASEAMLKESEHKFRSLFEMSPIGKALVDLASGRILQANNALLEFSQCSRVHLLEQCFTNLLSVDNQPLFDSLSERLRQVGRAGPNEMSLVRCDGTFLPIQLTMMLMKDAAGRDVVWSIIQDISNTKAAQAQLTEAARRDTLTGLGNRTLFMEKLQKALDRVRAGQQALFAVLFLDFDRFKLVNDTLGHDAGDELLKQITQRLRSQLRSHDTDERDPSAGVLCRFGGDEFLLLINHINTPQDAPRVAERLLNALAPPYDIFGSEVHSSASIGIVTGDNSAVSADDVVRNADVAMYEAKRAGRACSVVFNESMHTRLARHVTIETSLRRAIGSAELYVVYQPIVDLATGRVVSAEALLRWSHPTLGAISPGEFIPIAEESGLIIPVGRWVQQEACRALAEWQAVDPIRAPGSISVNLSRTELAQGNRLLTQLRHTIEQFGLSPNKLTLEVTEREVMRDPDGSLKLMNELRELGIQLSMDDFGTGTSSLGMLRDYPFDTIKIDRSFVNDLPGNKDVLAVIHATVNLIENLGMTSLAEGVEHPAQAAVLHSLGCRLAQGYWFSKPILPSQMLTTIEDLNSRLNIPSIT